MRASFDWKARLRSTGVIFGLALLASATGLLGRFDLAARDRVLRLQRQSPASHVTLVAIDDRSINELGRWPWGRSDLARLVERVGALGPTAIVIDLVLLDATPEDEVLGNALANVDSLLVGGFDESGLLLPPKSIRESTEIVHGVLELDGDGVLRRVASTKQSEDRALTAVAAAAAARVRPDLVIPVGRELIPGFAVRPDAVPAMSAADVMTHDPDSSLSGRVAFIGVTATGLGDRVVTPVTKKGQLEPGVLVHAAITEAIIADDLIRMAAPWMAALLASLIWFVASLTAESGGWRRSLLQVAIIVAPVIIGAASLIWLRIAFPLVLLTTVAACSVLFVEARTLLDVQRAVGSGADAEHPRTVQGASPVARVKALEAFARDLSTARVKDLESQRAVAHELKTPLTSIRGLAQLLAQYELSETESRRVATMVADESSRLKEMVDGLMDLEKLALGDRGAAAENRVDLGGTLARRATLARGEGRHSIALETEEELFVDGDGALLERMIENLVGNAMKFSPPDSTIKLRGARHDADIIIEVDDEGPGVPEAERDLVFRRFGRGSASREHAGLGLGLAFVAEIAAWHRGRVEVERGPRGGALFRVTLPSAPRPGANEAME